MQYKAHRENLYSSLETGSILLLFSGVEQHTNEDHYHDFEVNSQFFYLTGLERENMIFLAAKAGGTVHETLFIEAADPLQERWTGKMPTKEDASGVSGIQDIRYLDGFSSAVGRYMGRYHIEYIYRYFPLLIP